MIRKKSYYILKTNKSAGTVRENSAWMVVSVSVWGDTAMSVNTSGSYPKSPKAETQCVSRFLATNLLCGAGYMWTIKPVTWGFYCVYFIIHIFISDNHP